ncbi:BTAD domain-containing putative transcriptional regulator [Actinomadura macrotermitis]|nr:BTAD domain-containing putative transcriptional regulator [Actinomadura macrotermitis]
MLGPLEVLQDGEPLALGGANQRATLAYLLLNAGTVVSTSDLVRALWGDDAPPTARKMVQNAVAGLRRTLRDGAGGDNTGGDGPALLTVAPGYVLRMPPAALDATRFHELVRLGRAAFRAEAWQPAARLLREALALWRGPALADVAELGHAWPELATLDEQRLTALEDCAEAELALGLHRELAGELTPLAEEEPARERLCGLLMLALYRCGQQSEALAVFRRTRAALVEALGIEPAPELHRLQHAILNQDPTLMAPAATADPGTSTGPGTAPVPAERSRPAAAPRPMVERKRASVLLVRARVPAGLDDPERVAEALAALDRAVAAEAARYGGLVRGVLGSVRLVVFGVPRVHEDDPVRAVRAALAIRERLTGAAAPDATLRLAVATGDVLASYRDEGDPEPAELTGGVLEECEGLLERAICDTVRVCDRTRQAVGARFGHAEGDPAGGWRVTPGAPRPAPAPQRRPLLGRERDLARLQDLLDDVRRRRRPHLVTVLGEPGIGKSHLVEEFRASLPERAGDVRCLSAAVPPAYEGDADPLAGIVRSHAGFTVAGAGPGGAWPAPGAGPPRPACPADRLARATEPAALFAAWLRCLEGIAADGPLVVVFDDLHHTGTGLLRMVETLTERVAAVPLLVVATARPELLHRRPRWCGGRRDTCVLTLDPLPDDATAALLGEGAGDLLPLAAGNPLVALEYAQAHRRHTAPGPPPVPRRVTDLLTARLDTLPAAQKAVLRHAAVLGPVVSPAGVAAVSDRPGEEVVRLLRALDREGLLRRVASGPAPAEDEYAFAQPLLREVAYAQTPRRDRADGHRRAAEWAAGPPGRDRRHVLAPITGRFPGRA